MNAKPNRRRLSSPVLATNRTSRKISSYGVLFGGAGNGLEKPREKDVVNFKSVTFCTTSYSVVSPAFAVSPPIFTYRSPVSSHNRCRKSVGTARASNTMEKNKLRALFANANVNRERVFSCTFFASRRFGFNIFTSCF